MILYIGKVSAQEKDCPLGEFLFGQLIQWMFDDPKNVGNILPHFITNRYKLDEVFKRKGSSLNEALASEDRSLFEHIDLFPQSVKDKYGSQVQWYSNFLLRRMEAKYLKTVWIYLRKLDKQASE